MLAIYPQGTFQVTASGTTNDIERVVEVLQAHQSRVFKATVISTLIVSVAALINTYRLMRELRRGK